MHSVIVWHGNCLNGLPHVADMSVDAVVTDPPYGLEFMGKEWDSVRSFRASLDMHGRPVVLGQIATGREQARSGPLARGGTHSRGYADHNPGAFQHWCELWARECLRVLKPGGHLLAFGGSRTWHRLAAGVEDAGFEMRNSIAWLYGTGFPKSLDVAKAIDRVAGVERETVGERTSAYGTDTATGGRVSRAGGGAGLWVGPEPKAVPLRSPEAVTAAAQEWQGWGTALKPAFEPIVVARKPFPGTVAANVLVHGTGALNVDACRVGTGADKGGRWPTNVIMDGDSADALDKQSDGASRFFPTFRYTPKAPTRERPKVDGISHPTTKPLDLMRWLVRLVCPPGGLVLDPFAGSGTTGEAAALEGMRAILMEERADYLPLIRQRLDRAAG
jgi:DNA modification methylase